MKMISNPEKALLHGQWSKRVEIKIFKSVKSFKNQNIYYTKDLTPPKRPLAPLLKIYLGAASCCDSALFIRAHIYYQAEEILF